MEESIVRSSCHDLKEKLDAYLSHEGEPNFVEVYNLDTKTEISSRMQVIY